MRTPFNTRVFGISFLLFLFLTIHVKSSTVELAQEIPAEVIQFLKTFETALLSGNTEKVMSLMEADYRKAQHDGLLKGNTQQFLNEFQCGYRADNAETYECIDFGKVKAMENTAIIPDENLYIITYSLTGPTSVVNVTWMISVKQVDGQNVYGMVGTYG